MADGSITGGDVMIVFFSVMIGSFSIGSLSPAMTAIAAARGAAVTLFDVIDAVSSAYKYTQDYNTGDILIFIDILFSFNPNF